MKRRRPMQRSGRIKPKRRPPAEDLRIYGPLEFREWLHAQPCAICGVEGYTQQCHATNGGEGRKDDWQRTFPACGPHYSVAPSYKGLLHVEPVAGCHANQPPKVERLRLADLTYHRWLDEQSR